MICSNCHCALAGHLQLCFEERYQSPKRPFFPGRTCRNTLESLQRSVDEKCWSCSTFWLSFTPEQRATICAKSRSSREDPDGDFVTLTNHFGRWNTNSSKNKLSFHIVVFGRGRTFTVHESTNFQFPIFRHLDSLPVSCSTGSPETLSLAKDWIDNCLKNHSRCNFVPQGVWYPTRLLDSGPLDAKDTPKIKLIETAATVIDGPYMTLSHSWGKGHSLTLNKTSYQMLLDGIIPSVLPQTFREASNVARRVGVRYLWIDALCIFQDKDDLSDWNKEASQMHTVYAHSLCNIVAAETPDSSHSMFASRDPTTILPAYTEECVEILLDGTWTTRKYILTDEESKKEFENATINTRAWVMQERYMSPRALHFGRRQLFWECREAEAAETNPFGIELGEPGLKSQYEDVRDYLDKKSLTRTYDTEPGHVEFYHLVSEYSKRALNLSFHSDKLIAFSAILKHYSTVHNEEIVAGMRRSCLEDDLLWIRPFSSYNMVHGQVDLPCYEAYIAPSWSWASIRGSVCRRKRHGERILIRVEDYKLDHVTEDTTGAIRRGWLRLSGLLKPAKMRPTHHFGNFTTGWELEIDGFELVDRDSPMHQLRVHLDSWVDNFDQDNEDGRLFCMAAASEGPYNDTHSLLLKLVDASTGTFRRLGVVLGARGQLMHLLTAHRGSDCADSEQGKLPCIEYKNGRHSIYII